ncbi:MAG: tetratricopeptide repeat protein [bacterium]
MKRFLVLLILAFNIGFSQEAKKEDILFQEGLYHYAQGRYDLAIKAFSEIIEICPTYPKIEEMLVDSIKKRAESIKIVGSRESGVGSREEEKKLKPEKPLEYEVFKDDITIREETKTLTADEENYLFGRKIISLGMNDEGIAYLENLIKEKPKIGFADKILFTIGEAKRDVEAINKLLKEYPKTPLKYEARLLACELIFSKKDYKTSIIEYMKLIKEIEQGTITDLFSHLPPKIRNSDEIRVSAQIGLGDSYKELGDYIQAIVEYKKVLDEYPKIKGADDAGFYIADMYDRYPKVRDFIRAIEFYGRLIREYPDSKWVDRAKQRKKHIEENYL